VFVDNSRVVTLTSATNNGNTAAVYLGWSGTPGNLAVRDSALLNVGAAITVGTTGSNPSTMVVSNGASVSANVVGINCTIGNNYAPGNGVTVSGDNSKWTGQRSIYVGLGTDTSNFLIVADGAVVSVTSEISVGYGSSAAGNYLLVDSGTVTGTVNVGWNSGAKDNYVKIDNGGSVINTGNTRVGQGAGANGNYVLVTGTGSLWRTTGQLMLGSVVTAFSNSIVVSNGGSLVSPTGTTTINATNNYILVDGGTLVNGSVLQVGNLANNFGNYILVRKGGLFEVTNRIDVGKSSDASSVSNAVRIADGGVFQFTSATPDIRLYNTGSTGNAIVMDSGTLSYRGITNGTLPNLTNNTGTTYVGKFTWPAGAANAFRLNDCFATNSQVGGYTFAYNASDGKQYARLELVNGTTELRGQPVTIGSGGTLYVDQTAATLRSSLTLAEGATLAVGATNGLSVTVTAGLTVNGAGTLVLPAELAKDAAFKLIDVTGGGVTGGGNLSSWMDASGKYKLVLKNTTEVWVASKPPRGTLIRVY